MLCKHTHRSHYWLSENHHGFNITWRWNLQDKNSGLTVQSNNHTRKKLKNSTLMWGSGTSKTRRYEVSKNDSFCSHKQSRFFYFCTQLPKKHRVTEYPRLKLRISKWLRFTNQNSNGKIGKYFQHRPAYVSRCCQRKQKITSSYWEHCWGCLLSTGICNYCFFYTNIIKLVHWKYCLRVHEKGKAMDS